MGERPSGGERRIGQGAPRDFTTQTPLALVEDAVFARSAPFELRAPAAPSSGVVFSSPHSGRSYSAEFVKGSRLDLRRLRSSEDAYVDRLFAAAPEFGAPILSAIAPRAYVDLNRSPNDLDPSLLEGAGKKASNARVAAGLGVVPRIVSEGVSIYDGKLDIEHALARIRKWHAPYHLKLEELVENARQRFGQALLIDCHSMPSGAVALSHRRGAPVDVVLGDRFGASSIRRYIDAIEEAFTRAGFRVERNAPFAGGYITERFGKPGKGVSAIQIEIDRGIYMDQAQIAPAAEFDRVCAKLRSVIGEICGLINSAGLPSAHLAAE